jgi:hypothetical protein
MGMRKYYGEVQDSSGNAMLGASVRVRATGTQTLASLFQDDETTAKANPTTSDSLGMYSFNVAAGVYDIDITYNGSTVTLLKVQCDGSQTAFGATIVGCVDAAAARTALGLGTAATAANSDFVAASSKGQPGGVATLDDGGQVPLEQIPQIMLSANTTRYDLLTTESDASPGDWQVSGNFIATRNARGPGGADDVEGVSYPTSNSSHVVFNAGSGPSAGDALRFDTRIGDPGVQFISPGTWRFQNIWAYAYTTGDANEFEAYIEILVYKRASDGEGTFLFAATSPIIHRGTDYGAEAVEAVYEQTASIVLDPTDTLTFTIRGWATGATQRTLYINKAVDVEHINVVAPIYQTPLAVPYSLQGNDTPGTTYPRSLTLSEASSMLGLENNPRNKLINGNFIKWDYATQQTVGGYGSANRWLALVNGSTIIAGQAALAPGQTEVPGEPRYCYAMVVTSSAGAANYVNLRQRIEGVRSLAGQTATLSFYAKTNSAKNLAVEFTQNFGTGGSPSAAVTAIGVTTCAIPDAGFQRFTVTVDIPSISGKTIGTNNDDYLEVVFWFDAGSDYNSRTNSLPQQSGTFYIANVQLEAGPAATEFEQRSIALEELLCARYLPSVIGGADTATIGAGGAYSATQSLVHVPFLVEAKVPPTGFYVNAYAKYFVRRADATRETLTGLTFQGATKAGACLNAVCATGLVAGNATNLYTNAVDGQIYFTGCEL